ncbi:SCP-like protein [Ancylostoma ceylanicum]|uniref:SCP-like protein n=1 Tax=Ancylostoma ceylanicum TaxID=53326 RepID=A0A0D6LMC1_9BILA|nr:SCP-like protein [Ancylostoma ceylanicum]
MWLVTPFRRLWDCSIENHASDNMCGATLEPIYFAIKDTYKNKKSCDATETNALLKVWWSESTAIDLTQNQDYTANVETKAPKFSHMAAAEAKAFACTYGTCAGSSDLNINCVYNIKLDTTQNDKIYISATRPDEVCAGCNPMLPVNPCIYYLCQQEYISPSDIPSRACNAQDGMSGDLQAITVGMHNYYRRLAGSGWALDKSDYASPATKMTALEYDCATTVGGDTIGELTKQLAETCGGPYTATQGYSLNFHEEKDLTKTAAEVLKEGIKKWAEQSKLVDLDNGVLFEGAVETSAPNFAHIVNEAATKVVCSVTEDECLREGLRVAVCQYDKSLNKGDTVYTAGKACSKCPSGLKCDYNLGGGLCFKP